jgi:hypothetical protein
MARGPGMLISVVNPSGCKPVPGLPLAPVAMADRR